MKFSEEMKMMMQLKQLSVQKQREESLRAAQADYQKLLQKLLTDLKTQIRQDVAEGSITALITGNCDLPLSPRVQCAAIPKLENASRLFTYESIGGLSYFCWNDVAKGIYDGKHMASKNVCIEMTAAGQRLTGDLVPLAKEEGILLTFQPALYTKTARIILPAFGHYEKVDSPKHIRRNKLTDFCINMHYEIE